MLDFAFTKTMVPSWDLAFVACDQVLNASLWNCSGGSPGFTNPVDPGCRCSFLVSVGFSRFSGYRYPLNLLFQSVFSPGKQAAPVKKPR